jgi:hypothetical protein
MGQTRRSPGATARDLTRHAGRSLHPEEMPIMGDKAPKDKEKKKKIAETKKTSSAKSAPSSPAKSDKK